MSNKKKVIIGLLITIVIVMVAAFGYYQMSLKAVSNKSEKVHFQIIEGDSLTSITNRLDDENYIRNASVAQLYGKFNNVNTFQPGTYVINRNWSTPKILAYLQNPKNLLKDEVLLTFREGIWARDIAKIIEENTNVSADELIALWNDETFLRTLIERYEFLDESILNDEYRVKLEGYLFPETYYFMTNTTAETVTYTFLNQFEVVYNKLKDDFAKNELSIHEIVTLASVVQYESSDTEIMEKIAGVFYNRLAIGQKLESSVTVCYALYDFDSWLDCEKKTQEIDSPYNTYLYPGLPIGPILNPGYEALYATLNPKHHDYFYFLADVQGDGTVYFAKTYEEHLKNQEKYIHY